MCVKFILPILWNSLEKSYQQSTSQRKRGAGFIMLKRNVFDSVLMRCMNLEPIIQGEVKSERDRQI